MVITQYNPRKPAKWGFRNFVRSESSGIMYDFFICCGKTESDEKCTGSCVQMCSKYSDPAVTSTIKRSGTEKKIKKLK